MTAKPMTPRQRLLTAMRCEMADRVPIQVRGVYPTDPDWMKNHDESYRVLHDAVLERCDPVHPVSLGTGYLLIDRAGLDIRTERRPIDEEWVEDVATIHTPRGPVTEAYRVNLQGKPGFMSRHAVSSPEELERFLSIPDAPVQPDADRFFETVERVGERALVITELGSNPISMAHHLLGSENLALWSLTERDRLRHLLGVLRDRWHAYVERILDRGVTGVFATLGHEIALPPLLSPRDFREFVVETDMPVMHTIRGRGNLIHVHCHYNLSRVLDGFVELGVNCLHPVEAPPMGDIELAEAKRRLKGEICIEGNMQIGSLQMGTPNEIRRTTRKIIEDAGEGGGLILCPTASPFWPRLSDRARDNYLAFIEAGREFGGY